MTTIVCIKTNVGEDAIVLAADNQVDYIKDKETNYKSFDCTKIIVGDNYALAFAGNYNNKMLESFFDYIKGEKSFDKYLRLLTGKTKPKESTSPSMIIPYNLLDLKKRLEETSLEKKGELEKIIQSLLESQLEPKNEIESFVRKAFGKIKEGYNPVSEAISTGYFFEFYLLNRELCKKEDNIDESTSELILVSNKPSLEMYRVDPFRSLLESDEKIGVDYISLGTGSDLVEDFFSEEEYNTNGTYLNQKLRLQSINVQTAILLVASAMQKASHNPYTSATFDLTVVFKNRIEFNAGEIRDHVKQGQAAKILEISERYSKKT